MRKIGSGFSALRWLPQQCVQFNASMAERLSRPSGKAARHQHFGGFALQAENKNKGEKGIPTDALHAHPLI